jgi:hypothetical protein
MFCLFKHDPSHNPYRAAVSDLFPRFLPEVEIIPCRLVGFYGSANLPVICFYLGRATNEKSYDLQ